MPERLFAAQEMIKPPDVGVLDLIAERVRSKSIPGNRKDPYKLALVVEGGAMRSVVAAGSAKALLEIGAISAFDSAWGVSAGSAIAAYAISQQSEVLSTYWENFNKDYVFARWHLLGMPGFRIDFLQKMINEGRPLDFGRIAESGVDLHIFGASLKSAELVHFDNFKNREELAIAICKGMVVPFFTTTSDEIDGKVVDGSLVSGGLVLDQALAGDTTHALVLTSGDGKKLPKNLLEPLYAAILATKSPRIAKAFLQATERYNSAIEVILESKQNGASIDMINASQKVRVKRAEKSVSALVEGANQGYSATISKFSPFDLK